MPPSCDCKRIPACRGGDTPGPGLRVRQPEPRSATWGSLSLGRSRILHLQSRILTRGLPGAGTGPGSVRRSRTHEEAEDFAALLGGVLPAGLPATESCPQSQGREEAGMDVAEPGTSRQDGSEDRARAPHTQVGGGGAVCAQVLTRVGAGLRLF